MNRTRQLETMTLIRFYARLIVDMNPDDTSSIAAKKSYTDPMARMTELVERLDCDDN